MASTADLTGWMPVRLFLRNGEIRVDWRWLAPEQLANFSFFDHAVDHALQHPFVAAFGQETPVSVLLEQAEAHPGPPLAGIVYHMSRCGSTLLAGMLARCAENVVLSEPSPLDQILLWPLPEADRVRLLRAWMSCCVSGGAGTRAAYLKTDAWHIRALPVFRAAFPEARWVFLYRDPLEVIVSHVAEPSPWSLQGMMDPALLELSPQEAFALSPEDYLGKALGILLEWALRYADEPGGLLVEYSELPRAFEQRLLPHLPLAYSPAEIIRMSAFAQRNAKDAARAFVPDVARKQQAVKPWMRAVSERWIRPHYDALERRRLASG